MEYVIKGKSPLQMIERFLKRHGWERTEYGWALPKRYLVKTIQEAFQCQRGLFERRTVSPRSEMDVFLEGLSRSKEG